MVIVEPHIARRGVARRRQRVAGDGRPVARVGLARRRDSAARQHLTPLRPRHLALRHAGLLLLVCATHFNH
jgi:hypothetical protein